MTGKIAATVIPLRKRTIRIYLLLTLAVVAVIMILISRHSRIPESHVSRQFTLDILAVLDAGHGGLDGGAMSEHGVTEAPITLSVCQKTQALMRLFGVSAVMTRTDENSLDYDPNADVRTNKNADLKARLAVAQAHPGSDFLSIHLNKFQHSQYFGAQVFFPRNQQESKRLAEAIQNRMVCALNPANTREAKAIPNPVFLMERVTAPAVTIECGFLSNPEEEQKLQTDGYQIQISISVMTGYFDYLKGSIT